jgi:hypothetical protein
VISATVVETGEPEVQEMKSIYRVGLGILGVLSLADVAGPLLTDGQHPPMSVALVGAGIGVVSLVLLVFAFRGRTAAAVGLVVARVISAVTAVPAFFVSGVPAVAMIVASVFIGLTVLGIVCLLAGLRRPVPAVAR